MCRPYRQSQYSSSRGTPSVSNTVQCKGNTVPSSNMATERARSIVKRLVVGVLAPAVVAFGALVAVAAPASAAPVAPATGSGLVAESFSGSTVTDGSWRALGDGCLTRATVAPAASLVVPGRLRPPCRIAVRLRLDGVLATDRCQREP